MSVVKDASSCRVSLAFGAISTVSRIHLGQRVALHITGREKLCICHARFVFTPSREGSDGDLTPTVLFASNRCALGRSRHPSFAGECCEVVRLTLVMNHDSCHKWAADRGSRWARGSRLQTRVCPADEIDLGPQASLCTAGQPPFGFPPRQQRAFTAPSPRVRAMSSSPHQPRPDCLARCSPLPCASRYYKAFRGPALCPL